MDRRSVATRRRPIVPLASYAAPVVPDTPPTPIPTAQEIADIVFAGRRVDERRGFPPGVAPVPTIDSVLTASRLEAEAVGVGASRRFGEAVVSAAVALLWFGGAVGLGVTDLALVGVIAVLVPSLLRRLRRLDVEPLVASGFALFGAVVVSLLTHARMSGVDSLAIAVRLLASVTVADQVGRSALLRRGRLLRVLTVGLGAQVLISMTLRAVGRPWGSVGRFGLVAHPSVVGSLGVVVVGLVVAAAVSARRVDVWAGTALVFAGVAVGSSGSVTTFVGLLLVVGMAIVVSVRRHVVRGVWVAAVSLLIVGGMPGWVTAQEAWGRRAFSSPSAFAEWRASVRVGLDAAADHKWTGVGVGRSDAAAGRPQEAPLTVISEVGAPGVLALSGIVLSFVLLARRRRAPAWLPLIALVVPLLHDPWMWTSAAGMIVAALGFGGAIALSHESNVTEVVLPAR